MCLTPFRLRNVPNSSDVNWGPLSDTSCSGRPYLPKRCLSTCYSMVFAAVVLAISKTSGHFEWASTTTKYEVPKHGPAKLTWTLCQGRDGHIHRCKGATAGACLTSKQAMQPFTKSSMSRSIPGHHTWLRARAFMRWIPGWLACSSFSIAARNL